MARKPTSQDRRARIVQLTGAGEQVAKTYFEKHAKDLEAVMSVLSAKERRQIYLSLKKLGLLLRRRSIRDARRWRPEPSKGR